MKSPIIVDLFCGAGGTSTGLLKACAKKKVKPKLIAINHWTKAVETHTLNHPQATHLCANIESVKPREVVPGGVVDLLWASPECVFFSRARGGRPINDQRRSSAWRVLDWLTELDIKNVLLENVPEFKDWGPVYVSGPKKGRPIPEKKGEIFRAFVAVMHAFGYNVEWRILNCADYGDATSRTRFFLQARKGNRKIVWPTPSHTKSGENTARKWRGAKEIIDFSIPGKSIFNRKKPLSKNTLSRIEAGLRKFGGENAEPFIIALRGTKKDQINSSSKSVDEPLQTITAGGGHLGLCEPPPSS